MIASALDFHGKKVLVLGLGDSGLSCARWLTAHGAEVSVADSRMSPPHAEALAQQLPQVRLHKGAFEDALLMRAELLVASPGVPLATPAVARAMAAGIEVVGDIELFARAVHFVNGSRTQPMKIIAITGSNGKSTTTALTGELVKAAGLRASVAGNIGLPVLDALADAETGRQPWPDVWVLELSSFQLETTTSLDADVATVLNVSEDHLDRYADMAAYAAAKARIFQGHGVQVLNRDDARVMAMCIPGRRVISFGLTGRPSENEYGYCDRELCRGREQIMPQSDLPLAGLHNVANALAALALVEAIGLAPENALAGLLHFKGLPHRVENVGELNGVAFYDDSKGTNVGATEAALYGMGRKVVAILGGDGKGQDFSPLAAAVAANARAVVLIGRDGPAIGAAIAEAGVPLENAATLEEAVTRAYALAQPGDAVLLSPACASFDMFNNYVHRAHVFRAAVAALGVQR